MSWTFIASGTAATGNNATSLAPALPVGWAAGDLHVAEFQNFGGTNNRAPSMPAGWTVGPAWQNGTARHAVFWRQAQSGDTAPTVTLTGTGATGDTQLARIHGWRPSGSVVALRITGATSTNSTADNIGPVTGITPTFGDLVVLSCGKTNDFNGTASATGFTLATMTESTTGNDAGMACLYRTSDGTATGSVTVTDTGGTASNGLGFGVLLAFYTNVSDSGAAAGVETLTAAGTVDVTVVPIRPPGSLRVVLGLTGTPWRSYEVEVLSGALGTGQAGTVAVTFGTSITVSSVSGTGALGEFGFVIDGALEPVGAWSVAAAGAVTVGQTFNENVDVTGTAGTGTAGLVAITHTGSAALVGAASVGAAGEVFVGQAFTVESVQAAGQLGSLSVTGYVSVDMGAVEAIGTADDFTFPDQMMQSRIPVTVRVSVRSY